MTKVGVAGTISGRGFVEIGRGSKEGDALPPKKNLLTCKLVQRREIKELGELKRVK